MLVRPIEDAVRAIDGVKEMRSNAYQGGGFVLLEFTAGFDIDQAMDDVRKEVERAKKICRRIATSRPSAKSTSASRRCWW